MNNTMFRLEHAITVQRIQAGQMRWWVGWAVAIWFMGTIIAFSLGCWTHAQREYVVVWILSHAPVIKTVSYKGQGYDKEEIRTWLEREVYHGTLKDWAVGAAMMGGVAVVVAGGVGFWWVRREIPGGEHIRGAELVDGKELQRRLRMAGTPGVTIAGVEIPRPLERSHVLVCGSTGAGKSVAIRGLLRQIAARREPVVCVDLKGSFVREFFTPSRGDTILNPLDARCPSWSPWAECHSMPDMTAQAVSLFPVFPGMHATTAYYHHAAAQAYQVLLEQNVGSDARAIPGLLDGVLKKGLANRAGVLQTLELACQSFRYLEPGVKSWSAKEWVKNPQGWVFLAMRETEKAVCLPLVSLWLESITRQILTRPLEPEQTIWVIIDELAGLQAQPTLGDLMIRGREYGGAVVLGFQTVLQLYPLYGRDLTETILGQPATQLYLRTNNAETQAWSARNIGEGERREQVESETVGPENTRDSIHRSTRSMIATALLPAELGQFVDGQGILRVSYHGTARVQGPMLELVDREPAFIPRGTQAFPTTAVAKKRVLSRERRAV